MGKRKGSKNGVITQKMVCFKLDLELIDIWKTIPNKSKFLNNAIKKMGT